MSGRSYQEIAADLEAVAHGPTAEALREADRACRGLTLESDERAERAAAAEAERDALLAVAREASRHQCSHFAAGEPGGTQWCRLCEALAALPDHLRHHIEGPGGGRPIEEDR